MVDAILGSTVCKLQMLNLNGNQIGSVGGQKVIELLKRSPHLRVLDLSNNPVGSVLHQLKTASRSLEELTVRNCDLDPHGIESMLDSSHALRVIRIGENPTAGDLGAKAIARFVASSGGRTLVELRMEDNGVEVAGALALAGSFVKAYALRQLDMTGNVIGPRGAAAIMDALTTASTMPMDTINFSGCMIGDDATSETGRLLAHRGCGYTFLDHNDIHVTGAKRIADSVAASPCRIQVLDLSSNPIGDNGVKYLLEKVTLNIPQQKGRTVGELNIVGIQMGVEGAMAVKQAVEAHDVLGLLRASAENHDEKADGILKDAKLWECRSKPPGATILTLW